MKNLSDDTKAIVASNLTLAFFIREHMVYTSSHELRTDSHEAIETMFNQYLKLLEK